MLGPPRNALYLSSQRFLQNVQLHAKVPKFLRPQKRRSLKIDQNPYGPVLQECV